jgi:hypothetical protein
MITLVSSCAKPITEEVELRRDDRVYAYALKMMGGVWLSLQFLWLYNIVPHRKAN